jgi:hypothetical protein
MTVMSLPDAESKFAAILPPICNAYTDINGVAGTGSNILRVPLDGTARQEVLPVEWTGKEFTITPFGANVDFVIDRQNRTLVYATAPAAGGLPTSAVLGKRIADGQERTYQLPAKRSAPGSLETQGQWTLSYIGSAAGTFLELCLAST